MKRLCAALFALALALPAVVLGSDLFPRPPVPSSRDKLTTGPKTGKTLDNKGSLHTDGKPVKTIKTSAGSTRPITTRPPASLQ
jgi:hypothetical protein